MNETEMSNSASKSLDFDGSIQSLNLGSYSVAQVAELINWSNANNLSLPKRSPWVQIDPADPVEEPSKSHDSMTIGTSSTDGVRFGDEIDTPLQSAEPASNAPEKDFEVAPAVQIENAPDSSAQRFTEPIDDSHTQSVRSLATENSSQEPESMSRAALPESDTKDHDAKVPNQKTTIEARQPMHVETSNMSPVDSKEYLRRLESLVLDLNLQLARATGDVSDQDENLTNWLRRRVIELSLENMSLHEKLQNR